MESLDRHLEQVRSPPLAEEADPARSGAYRGYAELVGRWVGIAAAGARAREIGRSVAGTPLFSLETGPPGAGRASVLLAGIHAIEWIGVETMLALLERLVTPPPEDRLAVAFPLVNVDGYRRVEADLRAGRRRFRRANLRGVDLNRNWPAHFRASRRLLPFGWSHGGERPLSEPEVAAVASRLEEVAAGARIDRAVSFHSFGRRILTPWGGRFAPPPETPRLRRAAAAVRDRLPERYVVVQASHWAPGALARGTEIDHLFHRYGALSLLVECSAGGFAPREPASWLHPFRWFNPRRAEEVAAGLARALEPFVRGEDG